MNSGINRDPDGSTTTVLDPRGSPSAETRPLADRLETLEDATVGLLDNSKTNADVLLDEVGRVLKSEYGVAEIVSKRKAKSPTPADDIAAQLHASCDAVVNAYGDCGSCTSWCVYDSIDLEDRGTPTATVNSDEFIALGEAEARSLGMPTLPIVTVPHPMGDVPEPEVRERARGIVAAVVHVLTTDADRLASEYGPDPGPGGD